MVQPLVSTTVLPPRRLARVEDRRRQVTDLCLVQRMRHADVAKQLGVPVSTIRNDIQAIRKEVGSDLARDPTATDVLMDTLTSIDVRITAIHGQVNELESRKDAIIEGLVGDDDGEDGFSIMSAHAVATVKYTDMIRKLRKELRDEEAHRAEILKRFGVLREQVNVHQTSVTRDDTALSNALAQTINESPRDDRYRVAQAIEQRIGPISR
jgi:hypothetical protein